MSQSHLRRLGWAGMLVLAGLASACSSKPKPPVERASASASASASAAGTAHLPPRRIAAKQPATAGESAQSTVETDFMDRLMPAVFGAGYRPASHDAVVELPDLHKPASKSSYLVTPVAVNILADGAAVLIANAESADENGQSRATYKTPGLLNVYLFARDGEDWKVLKRHDNVAELGSEGYIGAIQWLQLGNNKPGFAVLHGAAQLGGSIRHVSLFDLRAASLSDLTGEPINVHSDTNNACLPLFPDCWDISATVHMSPADPPAAYDDLVLLFAGEESVPRPPTPQDDAKDPVRIASRVHGQARYAYDGKRYRLVDGTNPVPSL